jgi:hypothetical protein
MAQWKVSNWCRIERDTVTIDFQVVVPAESKLEAFDVMLRQLKNWPAGVLKPPLP